MPLPTSERRLTRSQTRMGAAPEGAVTPSSAKPPASAAKVRAGRRVLAAIDGNDSPIIGLVPGFSSSCANTPSSHLKSALASRRPPPVEENSAIHGSASPGSTPLGENLLRSQVQLLLEKVESEAIKPPSLRTLCHLNGCLDSPRRLAAPTPLNTPATGAFCNPSVPTPAMAASASSAGLKITETAIVEATSSSSSVEGTLPATDESNAASNLQESRIKVLLDLNKLPASELSQRQASTKVENGLEQTSTEAQITIAESVTSGSDHQVMQIAPLIYEAMDVESKDTDLFLGKKATRTLHFESPAKVIIEASQMAMIDGESGSVRELEDDEVSEWSVLVNVSSPAGKQDAELVDEAVTRQQAVTFVNTEAAACPVHEHLQKNREESNKVDLLWSDRRKATPYRKRRDEDEEEEDEEGEEEEEEGEEEEEEAYCREEDDGEGQEEYGEWEGEEDYGADCDVLCRSFRGMKMEEEDDDDAKVGLPRGEGKHIRFLYDSEGENIEEEMEVTGESMVSSGAVLLRGLPAPQGRHLRFRSSEEDDDQATLNHESQNITS